MGTSIDLIRATPNTLEAIRKAHAIRKDLRPDGTVQYSFPASKPSAAYRGMWSVSLNDSWQFTVPASESGNIILTEDRLFENVTQELVSQGSAASSGWTWCYLHISLQRGIELITAQTPYSVSYDYADYTDDYVPLAKYSPETGVIQLQYGAVRINRYWLVTGGGSGGGGGEDL